MFRKILHPTDLSATAFQAFGHAVVMARRNHADLELLHVLATHDFASIQIEKAQTLLEEAYEEIERSLKHRASEVVATSSDDFPWDNLVFRRGYSVAEEIVTEANAKSADLVVMGTHGGEPVRQFFLGSVAEKVVRYAPCPVLVCGRGGRAPERFEKILVPIDFSSASHASAELALEIARADGSELCFLHVIEDKPQPPYLDGDTPLGDDQEIRHDAEDELARFVSKLDGKTVKWSRLVAVGRPSRKITEYAEAQKFDLIAMGTSGLRGISRFLLGSTPARVMRRCKVPVLAVHGSSEDPQQSTRD